MIMNNGREGMVCPIFDAITPELAKN